MPTYVYETIPGKPEEKSLRFEVQQGMMDPPPANRPRNWNPGPSGDYRWARNPSWQI